MKTRKTKKKRGLLMLLLVIAVVLLCYLVSLKFIRNENLPDDIEMKAQELKEYCEKRGYDTNVGVMVDYGVHSGCMRFVVWDFNENKPLLKSICAQGCGKGKNWGKNVFSNEIGSLCSSLGHYKIGKERTMNSIKGRPALNLYGLDSTNSNAYVRGILLHPVRLPSKSIYPFEIPTRGIRVFGRTIMNSYSEGCVTIPFDDYYELVSILNEKKEKPVILWVYV